MEGSDQQGWTAIHDFMPPNPGLLTVRGESIFPTPGYKVVLRKAVPQGVNKKILLLNKIVTPPAGKEPQIISNITAEYQEVTRENYSEVQILPDNIKIKVEEVH